jgi:hypothetical protein
MLGDKYFLWNAIPNLILILLLLYYLSIRKGVGAVIAALFVYLSLHGGYAIFAAATGDGINTLNKLHYESSDLGAKLSGLFFMICCAILLMNRLHHPIQAFRGNFNLVLTMGYLLFLFLFIMTLGTANLKNASTGKLLTISKETFFAAWMWAGAIVFAIVLKQGGKYLIAFRGEWIGFLAAISVLMAVSGAYEVATGVVWAGTSYASGFSYRASGALFNPNVLGFWSALMVALISFMFHIRWISRLATIGFMLLFMACLILSSSRSGLMLSIINLLAIAFFMMSNKKHIQLSALDKFWPLISFVMVFFVCAGIINYINPSQSLLANTLFANLQRFIQLPTDIFWIFMMKIYFPIAKTFSSLPALDNMQVAANTYVSGHMSESVNGRMVLEYTSDNSYMSIYAVGSIASLVIWLWLWAVLLWLGIAKNRKASGIYSSYALVGLIFCFSSGLFLRSPQLFPIWIFMSMVLGACLCWWLLAENNETLGQNTPLGGSKIVLP